MEAVVFAIGVACAVQTCAIFLLIRSYRAAPLLTPSSVTTTTALPFVSVIVPARDEELNIEDCVESIAAQEYPTFEIVVIDDQSADATPAAGA